METELNELTKKYDRLVNSYNNSIVKYKTLEQDFINATNDRNDALKKSAPVLEEKYDKLKRDYNSLNSERNDISRRYSHIQRVHETCILQEQEAQSRIRLLTAQMVELENKNNWSIGQINKLEGDVIKSVSQFKKMEEMYCTNEEVFSKFRDEMRHVEARYNSMKIDYEVMRDKFEDADKQLIKSNNIIKRYETFILSTIPFAFVSTVACILYHLLPYHPQQNLIGGV